MAPRKKPSAPTKGRGRKPAAKDSGGTAKAKANTKKPALKGARKARQAKAAPAVILNTTDGIGDEPARHPGGRPTDYRPEYAEQGRKLWESGFTDQEVADFFGVTKKTIYNWQVANQEFLHSAIVGKEAPDLRMTRSLYARGNGFEWIEQQAFKCKSVRYENGERIEDERVEVVDVRRFVPPDTQAATFWLRNRRRDLWPDTAKAEMSGPDGAPLMTDHSPREMARAVLDLLRSAQVSDAEEAAA